MNAAAGRGLQMDGPRLHEFLYYRALALLREGYSREFDANQCLTAALILCRAKGDYEFSNQVLNSLKSITQFFMRNEEFVPRELSEKEIRRIIDKEIRRTAPAPKKCTEKEISVPEDNCK